MQHTTQAVRKFLISVARALLLVVALPLAEVAAQDINNGKLLYTTPLVSGQLSCSTGACHAVNPLGNQNRVLLAADNPGAIGIGINSVGQMAFLKGKVTGSQLQDIAAYIGNPQAATGAPIAQLLPTALSFAPTVLGSTAAAKLFAINNTGTAALTVSSVSSNSAEFLLAHNCALIAVSGSCNVSVRFAPTAAGNRSGTITVNHNASGGSSTLNVSGTATAPVVSTPGILVSPIALDFDSVTVGTFADAQPVVVTSVGTAPLVITSLSEVGPHFAVVGGSCALGAQVSVNASCTILLRFSPSAEGAQSSILNIGSNANTNATAVSLTGTGAAPPPSNTKTMVEYRFVPLNYFFITSHDTDKVILDAIPDFRRTGQSFQVLASEVNNAKSITRFYFDKIAVAGSRGSHFYTLIDDEKNQLAAINPTNANTPRLPVNEGVDSWAYLPVLSGPTGFCANGLIPVYRLFRGNLRFPDDPNHRFTVSTAIYNEYVALGWDGEGVRFCVPSQ